MNPYDQQPDLHDEQAVIAAVQILIRSLKPTQKEKLLSTLWHEQEEPVSADDAAHHEQSEQDYLVQPLLLASSEEGQHGSSTDDAQGEPENPTEMPREFNPESVAERNGRWRIFEGYAAHTFFPLASSFSRQQWWARLLIAALFLFALSLSTLFAYNAGVQANQAHSAISGIRSSCSGNVYFRSNGRPFFTNQGVMHGRIVITRVVENGPHAFVSQLISGPGNDDSVTWISSSVMADGSVVWISSSMMADGSVPCYTTYPIGVVSHHDRR